MPDFDLITRNVKKTDLTIKWITGKSKKQIMVLTNKNKYRFNEDVWPAEVISGFRKSVGNDCRKNDWT